MVQSSRNLWWEPPEVWWELTGSLWWAVLRGFSPHRSAETGTLPIPPQGTSLIIRAPEKECCSERSWVTLCFQAFFPFLLFLPSVPCHSLLKNFYLKLFLVWCEHEMYLIGKQINVDLLWSKPVSRLEPP